MECGTGGRARDEADRNCGQTRAAPQKNDAAKSRAFIFVAGDAENASTRFFVALLPKRSDKRVEQTGKSVFHGFCSLFVLVSSILGEEPIELSQPNATIPTTRPLPTGSVQPCQS